MFSSTVSPVGSLVGGGRSCVSTFAWERSSEANAVGSQAILDQGLKSTLSASDPLVSSNWLLGRIKEGLLKAELSVSAYDTAWVAMVPSPRFPKTPSFPDCVDWIIDNQHSDGSWGPTHNKPSLIKDVLSSTLACILALSRWSVGEEYVKKGLSFIASNFSSSMNEKLPSPVGFTIIFPGMISYALQMGLDLPLWECDVDAMLYMRDVELRREAEKNSAGSKSYLAFVTEGLSGMQDWQAVMSFQRKNGSLFNSPSSTAAVLCHLRDDKSLNYLTSILQKFGCSGVPTTYPLDIYTHLSMVDKLEKLGVSMYFVHDIRRILDKVYRCWMEKDEEVYSDVTVCAMAFRILRMHGYDLSSDALSSFADVRLFKNTLQGYIRDLNAVIELCRASQPHISPEEPVLKKLSSWTTDFLTEELSSNAMKSLDISREIDYTLRFPFYSNLERLEHKRNIEHYNLDNFRMLKTSYMSLGINSKDLLEFAVDAFSSSQMIYRKELQYLENWVKESKLDQLGFARQKQTYGYLSAAATLFSPELSSARQCWAKGSVLATIVDDFFDGGGSSEELANLVALIEKWHEVSEKDFGSENVKIIFFALYDTINELGAKASMRQKRDCTNHIINIWLAMMNSMMKEADWLKNSTIPTLDEYMAHAIPSFALGPIIIPSLYFVGPELLEIITGSTEYDNLFKLVSKLGRLLNDLQGFERDTREGKLNSLKLLVHYGNGLISEEEARRETRNVIESTRAELLGLVLRSHGSVVPRACKDLFWKMSRILHFFYRNNDGFTSPKEMLGAVNAVIHEPLQVSYQFFSEA
ncbi:hypothetical protein KSP39_PZI010040 [Platanthera zijinensis]|uniref:Ent-kaurene synthase n=1 Tax=Platanthera zijinensis TaxID=2320716 RepID=A0AAP0BM27_9ASPA